MSLIKKIYRLLILNSKLTNNQKQFKNKKR